MSGQRAGVAAGRPPEPQRTAPASSPRRIARTVVMVLGCIVHAVLGVTVFVSGLIMPNGAVLLLGLFWIAGVAVMIRGRRLTALLLAVPIASWAVWFTVVWIGETWLGWAP